MKQQILFKTTEGPNAEQVLVEVEAPASGGPVSARSGDVVASAVTTLEAAFDKVRRVAELAASRLKDLHVRPNKVSLELAVKFDAKAGVVFTSAGVEANVKIVLTWGEK